MLIILSSECSSISGIVVLIIILDILRNIKACTIPYTVVVKGSLVSQALQHVGPVRSMDVDPFQVTMM